MSHTLPPLPPTVDLETKAILKKVALANRHLAELKGFARKIPNQRILINAIGLQEAKDSSEIENIITTHDELYKASIFNRDTISHQAKEVKNYAKAIYEGYDLVKKRDMLTLNDICLIQSIIEQNNAGLRKQAGTVLKNADTGEVVYTPPQDADEILKLMGNLETIINNDTAWADVDPLIKMAIIHYQFESIHPFFDGNGRTGRIINVLYLVLKKLLDTPILYLSRYIISHKSDYYAGLQRVRTHQAWETFVDFMLDAVIETSIMANQTIQAIDKAMQTYKHCIRSNEKLNFYSRDLVDALFLHPYTRIAHLEENLKVSRLTATNYLKKLTEAKLLNKIVIGRNYYFVNPALFEILSAIPMNVDHSSLKVITDKQ